MHLVWGLFVAGLVCGAAGGMIWLALSLIAVWRDASLRDILSVSASRRLAALPRHLGATAGIGRSTGLGRIANLLLTFAVTCLMAAGIGRVVALIVANQGGTA